MLTIEKVKFPDALDIVLNRLKARFECDKEQVMILYAYVEKLDAEHHLAMKVVEAANAYAKVYLSPVESDYLESSVSQKLIQSLKPFSPQPTKP